MAEKAGTSDDAKAFGRAFDAVVSSEPVKLKPEGKPPRSYWMLGIVPDHFTRMTSQIHTALSVCLFLVLIAAFLLAVPPSLLIVFLIGLFGGDSPYTSGLQITEWLCIPAAEVAFTILGAWWSLWLWNKPRGKFAAFPIALGLLAASIGLWAKLIGRQ